MAIIHVTEAEAARDFSGLLAKVRAGERVHVDDGTETLAVIHSPARGESPRLASAILAALEKRGSTEVLPDGFADRVEQGIQSHEHEVLRNPWEYP